MSTKVEEEKKEAKIEPTEASKNADELPAEDDPTTKQFQEKYYPLLETSINKYDPYTM